MEFDAEMHLSEIERIVTFLELDGHPSSAVTMSRNYSTTLEDLWDAITNTQRIPRWFAPVSGELQLGGRYQVEGNAADRSPPANHCHTSP